MTVEWFDLAQRLAAASSEDVVARLAHSPVWPTNRAVATRAQVRGDHVTVTACERGGVPQTRRDADGLRMLGDLGVLVSSDRHTLITDEPGTVAALARLAHRTREDGRLADVAAHVGWWANRADFPGTSAVVNLVDACQTRWVTGAAPEAERSTHTWRTWLGLDGTDNSTAGLFALLDRVTEGVALPMLGEVAADDEYAFSEACRSHTDGWDWRGRDSISRAAAGLRARCDTADIWAAALLDDPLFRRRAVHTGHVVHGQASIPTSKSTTRLQVVCDRMDARLRTGSEVVGWVPGTDQRFSGSVTGTGVTSGRLALDLTVGAATRPPAGARVTLIPSPPNVHRARRGRRQYRSLYSTRTSWLTTGRTPAPQRRDVPLDVLFAGATDD